MIKAFEKEVLCCLLVVLFGLGHFSFPQTAPKKQEDEIIKLEQELLRLKMLLKEVTQALSEDEKEKLKEVIEELEETLKKKQKQDKYSHTTRKINRLKLAVEKVKEDLKKLSGGIEFSGFFDVTASGYKDNPNVFALGDFELDMEKSFSGNFQVASALVFSDDGAELGVGFIDFHLFGGPVAARGRLFTEKGFHIQVGRFDVPFANDWQYFAPVDRLSVTAPLTTEIVMDGGFNDVGLRILGAAVTYNYTLYMLRGSEEGIALGGRFGFTPFNNPFTLKKKELQLLEIGLSYIYDMNRGGSKEEKALALDFESQLGALRLQGEYVRRDFFINEIRLDGFQLSAFLDAGKFSKLPVTLYSRYDYLRQKPTRAETGEKEKLGRLTVGLNVNLFDISMLKVEFLHFLEDNEEFTGSSFFAQLVITF